MKKYFLLSSEHLEDGLWFRDESDFIVAMNHVAIEASRFAGAVKVIAFVLMSNHVHFVLFGRKEDVIAFITSFKRRYSHYYSRRHGESKLLKHNDLDVAEISWDEDGLLRAIAYVHMNPVSARICSHPTQYQWGSGCAFFNSKKRPGKCLEDISGRTKRLLFHSHCSLPEKWKMGYDGFVLPEDYVDVATVEKLFHTPNNLNYFYNTSSKAKKRLESEHKDLPAFRDQTILLALPDICRSLFGTDSFDGLSQKEKKELILQLRYRFSADITQIARVCGITYAEAARIREGF